MADGEAQAPEPPAPLVVEYDPVTGVPPEFNEHLPKDSEEYKRWKASREAGMSGAMAGLTVGGEAGGGGGGGETGGGDAAAAAAAPAADKKGGGSSKKKKGGKPEVVLERNTRNKKKCITTISGLDAFGVKLPEAAKLFGKKFASGASVVKNAEGKEHIDVQGDCLDQAAQLIVKQWKDAVQRGDIFYIDAKKKQAYFEGADAE